MGLHNKYRKTLSNYVMLLGALLFFLSLVSSSKVVQEVTRMSDVYVLTNHLVILPFFLQLYK